MFIDSNDSFQGVDVTNIIKTSMSSKDLFISIPVTNKIEPASVRNRITDDDTICSGDSCLLNVRVVRFRTWMLSVRD